MIKKIMQIGRYWGRKPEEQVMKYVSKYSQINDVILDSFSGSGGIIYGALKLGRRAIYNDLNPVAQVYAKANLIKKQDYKIPQIEKTHNDLYMIDYNGEKAEVRYYLWEKHRVVGARLYGGQLIDLNGIDYQGEIPYWYPKVKFQHMNGRHFEIRTGVRSIEEFYTRRNLLILTDIYRQLDKSDEKQLLAFFVALQECNKSSVESHGSTGIPSLWVPKRFIEKNPYRSFEFNIERTKEAGLLVLEGSIADVLSGLADVSFLNNDAKKLPLDDESIDAIVTDPPFFDEIQYFELSYIYASWLNVKLDFDNEIIVNYNRRKNEPRYLADLEKAIQEMHRVLKKNKYLVLMFHEEEELKLKKVQNIISKYFSVEKVENETMQQRQVGDRDAKRGTKLKVFVAKKV